MGQRARPPTGASQEHVRRALCGALPAGWQSWPSPASIATAGRRCALQAPHALDRSVGERELAQPSATQRKNARSELLSFSRSRLASPDSPWLDSRLSRMARFLACSSRISLSCAVDCSFVSLREQHQPWFKTGGAITRGNGLTCQRGHHAGNGSTGQRGHHAGNRLTGQRDHHAGNGLTGQPR